MKSLSSRWLLCVLLVVGSAACGGEPEAEPTSSTVPITPFNRGPSGPAVPTTNTVAVTTTAPSTTMATTTSTVPPTTAAVTTTTVLLCIDVEAFLGEVDSAKTLGLVVIADENIPNTASMAFGHNLANEVGDGNAELATWNEWRNMWTAELVALSQLRAGALDALVEGRSVQIAEAEVVVRALDAAMLAATSGGFQSLLKAVFLEDPEARAMEMEAYIDAQPALVADVEAAEAALRSVCS